MVAGFVSETSSARFQASTAPRSILRSSSVVVIPKNRMNATTSLA